MGLVRRLAAAAAVPASYIIQAQEGVGSPPQVDHIPRYNKHAIWKLRLS